MIVKILVSLIPVFLFLLLMLYLDSLRLVNKTLLLFCLAWGIASAILSFVVNTFLIRTFEISFDFYSGWIAPFVEEFLKMFILLVLIRKNRIGFMIDAAIYGFAIGSAFAMCENLFYLFHFAGQEGNLMVWITRGFGTSLMHGGTVAIFGIMTMSALNRSKNTILAISIGMILAVFIHGLYNQFLVSPLVSTLIIVVIIPVIISLIFQGNEKSIRKWLEMEFDSEVKILGMIRKGRFSETKSGSFLVSIKKHFPPEVVLDIYCFISLYMELSIKAKSVLMLKENDLPIPSDPGIKDKLQELKNLRKSIGKAGFLAIAPILRMSKKDLWKISLLEAR
jgi:RsiW-degrading membrane proteinase PrsW (M82 family)